MKKILYFAIIACLAGFASACSDDSMDNPYATDDALAVISNDVMIPSKGGSGTIVVDGQGTVTAESSLSWCTVSVSGNTITVSASENNSIESRNAVISIRSGNKSTQVVAYQDGLVFSVTDKSFSLNDDEVTLSTPLQLSNPSLPVTVGEGVDWVTADVNPSTGMVDLHVAANNTGLPRSGSIELVCSDYKTTISFSQFDFNKDVLGEYYFGFYGNSSGQNYGECKAVLSKTALTIYPAEGAEYAIPVKFTNGTRPPFDLTVEFGKYTGDIVLGGKNYYAYVAFDRVNYNFLGRYPNYFFNYMSASTATLRIEDHVESNGYAWYGGDFGGTMNLDGDDYGAITNWYLLAMTENAFDQAVYAGSLYNFFYPFIEKVVTDDSDAKVARAPHKRAIK